MQFFKTPLCFGVHVAQMVVEDSGAGRGSSNLKSREYIIFKDLLDSELPGCSESFNILNKFLNMQDTAQI